MLHQTFASSARKVALCSVPATPTHRFVMFLTPGFSLLNMSGFLEALDLANRLLGREAFHCALCSEDGSRVRASCGVMIPVEAAMTQPKGSDNVIFNMGAPVDSLAQLSASAKTWIKSAFRHCKSAAIMGASTEALAQSGCLTQSATYSVHWRNLDFLRETYPELEFSRSALNIGERCASAIGATAGVDLALWAIEKNAGPDLARKCVDELNYTAQYKVQTLSSDAHPALSHIDNDKIRSVVAEMERCIEDVPTAQYFADFAGISGRQLERLFQEHLGLPPKRFFLHLRLERGRNLLLQTEMSVMEVAVAIGFGTSSTFSKKFREHFGQAPGQIRRGRAA